MDEKLTGKLDVRLPSGLLQKLAERAAALPPVKRPGRPDRRSEVVRLALEEFLSGRPATRCPAEREHALGAWLIGLPEPVSRLVYRIGEAFRTGQIDRLDSDPREWFGGGKARGTQKSARKRSSREP